MDTNAEAVTSRIRGLLTRMAAAALLLSLVTEAGCSVKGYTTRLAADALSRTGTTYASDEDVELVGLAIPFALKTMELVLAEQPQHRSLLLAASRAFTQYAYLYVEWPAEQLEERDVNRAYRERDRARRLYLRARDYGLRGLEAGHPNFTGLLSDNPAQAVAIATNDDVPLLYWTAVSWAAAISLGKDDPYLLADLPLMEALITRALALDESFEQGSIHVFLVRYEMSRPGSAAGAEKRARRHFARAVELSGGELASPYLAFAQAVCIANQDRAQFEDMLHRALAVDVDLRPEHRLENLAMQAQAQWLLERVDRYIAK